jgi:amino acid transporter
VASFTPIEILGDLVSLGTLLAFAIVRFSALYLRVTQPDMPGVLRVPFDPFTPLLGSATRVWLMLGILNMMVLLFEYYTPAGLLIYFLPANLLLALHAAAYCSPQSSQISLSRREQPPKALSTQALRRRL